MSQKDKILEMCYDNQYHCQAEFWRISKSPHKRRIEIEGRQNENEPITGRFKFISRPCEHEIQGSHDFLMVENETFKPEPKKKVEFINGKPTLIYA